MFSKIKSLVTNYFKNHFLAPLLPDPINGKRDFILRITFICFAALCCIGGLVVGLVAPWDNPLMIIPSFLIGCSLPFLPKIITKTFRVGKKSYSVGKSLTTREYIEINQVSSTQYRATHEKQHDGDLIALFAGVCTFIFTWLFYMMFGPFLLGYKIYKVACQMYEYKQDMSGVNG